MNLRQTYKLPKRGITVEKRVFQLSDVGLDILKENQNLISQESLVEWFSKI